MLCTRVVHGTPVPRRFSLGFGTPNAAAVFRRTMPITKSQPEDNMYNKPEFQYDSKSEVPGENVRKLLTPSVCDNLPSY